MHYTNNDDSAVFLIAGTLQSYSENNSVNIVTSENHKKVIKPWGHELWYLTESIQGRF